MSDESAVTEVPAAQVESEALALPLKERARLAEVLIASLDEDAVIEQAWSAEIARRVAELDAGTAHTIPAEEVFAELDEMLR